jgi:glycosyltransferase involved in cell wall biosynthesis
MNELVFATVIIPVYNSRAGLEKCLGALRAQTYPRDKFEIIIVDDGSTDGAGGLAGSIQRQSGLDIKYYYQENKGPAAARNLGIKHSRGNILAFIDSDCIPAQNWLEEILKGYDQDKTAGVGGVIEAVPTASSVSQYCAYARMNRDPKIDAGGIVYLITGNASFRRDRLIYMGGFDERFDSPGGEDLELCQRLKQNGYIFQLNHNAVVYNSHKLTLRDLTRTYFNYGKGQSFLTAKKNAGRAPGVFSGMKWFSCFFQAVINIFFMPAAVFKTLFRFIKIPFYALYYYGKGLSARDSLRYAAYDYLRSLAFSGGRLAGDLTAGSRGFKKT